MNPTCARIHTIAAALLLSSCSGWLFSGYDTIDRTKPVALVETTGGVEFGATTEFGILTLGRTAQDGPCRVHYFLGPTPMIEDGVLRPSSAGFCRADIDLKTQSVRVLDRNVTRDDEILAMWTPDGTNLMTVDVGLAAVSGVQGDVLRDPGCELPAGAALFVVDDGNMLFVGLVSGRARLQGTSNPGDYYVFSGFDRIREMLAVPEVHPTDYETKFRPDNITVQKPAQPSTGK